MKKHTKVYMRYFDLAGYNYTLCEVCNKIASDIHHIIYRSHCGKDEIENLIALCISCHNKAHGIEKPRLTKEYLKQVHLKKLESFKI